jgi:hypothetical protein
MVSSALLYLPGRKFWTVHVVRPRVGPWAFFGIPVGTLSDKQSPRPAKLADLDERTLPMSEPHLKAIGVMDELFDQGLDLNFRGQCAYFLLARSESALGYIPPLSDTCSICRQGWRVGAQKLPEPR